MTTVREAAERLRAGGVVAFPTETVYGLGADATNAEAVARIFQIKGRPATNPLIVHVANVDAARRYAAEWPLAASQLADRFWPGPLTLVLPKSPQIVPAVTAGLDTVGLRMPDHPVALQLLREFGGAVAAPSANRSNRVSPTSARHVRDEFGDAVDLVLDGGPCRVGIESTVLDLSGGRPAILRPGGVSRDQIEAVVGKVDAFSATVDDTTPAASPGQHLRHYAPRTPAYRATGGQLETVLRDILDGRRECPAVLFYGTVPGGFEWETYVAHARSMPESPDEYAQQLYAALRYCDSLGLDEIFVEMPPDGPEWAAVRDRIVRATQPLERLE